MAVARRKSRRRLCLCGRACACVDVTGPYGREQRRPVQAALLDADCGPDQAAVVAFPILNIFVPHVEQVPVVESLPFFIL